MGQVIQFEERAVARLRERLGLVEEANDDLVAFARGHSGAVASIHAAALAAIDATSIEAMLEIITCDWPPILGIDAAAAALVVDGRGFRADCGGIERVEARFVDRMIGSLGPIEIRSAAAGHPLFGVPAAAKIRAEALIRIDSDAPYPAGLVALGQRTQLAIETAHGSELLFFLGQIVARTLRRCNSLG
ncbi:MAG TPA: DUF484 family protein [Sphingomicrobium sp.]|nr:DUF484 family protein [Sphingomicrobium sp.]